MPNTPSAIEILKYFNLDENTRVYKYASKKGKKGIEGAILAYADENEMLFFAEKGYIKKELIDKTQKCIGGMQELKAMPLNSTDEKRNSFYEMLSSAFVQACYGNIHSAYVLTDKAKLFYKAINTEKARKYALITACGIAVSALLALVSVTMLKTTFHCLIPHFELIVGALMGGLGATVSVWQRYGKSILTGYYDTILYILEVLARSLVGAIFAVVLIAMFKAGWVSSNLVNVTGMTLVNSMIIGFIGGFSERFVPAIVEQFTSDKEQKYNPIEKEQDDKVPEENVEKVKDTNNEQGKIQKRKKKEESLNEEKKYIR